MSTGSVATAISFSIASPQPVRTLEARAEDKQVKVVAGIDGAAVAVLLEKAEGYLATLAAQQPAGARVP